MQVNTLKTENTKLDSCDKNSMQFNTSTDSQVKLQAVGVRSRTAIKMMSVKVNLAASHNVFTNDSGQVSKI